MTIKQSACLCVRPWPISLFMVCLSICPWSVCLFLSVSCLSLCWSLCMSYLPAYYRTRLCNIISRGHVQSASVSSSSCFSAVSHQQSWTDLNPHTRIPVHLRPPVTVSVYAHRNGSRHSPVKVTSRANLKQVRHLQLHLH